MYGVLDGIQGVPEVQVGSVMFYREYLRNGWDHWWFTGST
jgi:hypothetical protein